MNDESRAALDLAMKIAELMDGREFGVIAVTLGKVLAEFLVQTTDGPEEADKLLATMTADIREDVARLFLSQIQTSQSKN